MTTIEFAGILLAADENGTPSGSSGDPMRILRVPRAPGKGRPGRVAIRSGGGGNEAVGAWETVAAKGRLQVGRPQRA